MGSRLTVVSAWAPQPGGPARSWGQEPHVSKSRPFLLWSDGSQERAAHSLAVGLLQWPGPSLGAGGHCRLEVQLCWVGANGQRADG